MIKKSAARRQGRVRVVFRLPAASARKVQLVGQFSDWQPITMRPGKDGIWEAAVELEPQRAYEFRYVVDEREWMNDPAADKYMPNPFGGQNSVALT